MQGSREFVTGVLQALQIHVPSRVAHLLGCGGFDFRSGESSGPWVRVYGSRKPMEQAAHRDGRLAGQVVAMAGLDSYAAGRWASSLHCLNGR